jgi:chaperonin cofactor prefoldin
MSSVIEDSAKELDDQIKVLKNLEEESSKTASNIEVIRQLSKIKCNVTDEKVKETLQLLSKAIDEKLSAYDNPINTHSKQIKAIRESMETLQKMVNTAINTVKITGWVIGIILTLFSIFSIIKDQVK